MPQTRIFLSGDSTTYGYGDTEHGGWGDRLKQAFMDRARHGEIPAREVINLALSSQSTEQIARRFPSQVSELPRHDSVAVFMVGAIDSVIRQKDGKVRLSLPQFEEALHELHDACAEHEVKPMFVAYHQVDETRTNPWHNGDRFINQNIQEYNAWTKAIALERDATFIELDELSALTEEQRLASDGLHPSPAGHQIIKDTVLVTLSAYYEDLPL